MRILSWRKKTQILIRVLARINGKNMDFPSRKMEKLLLFPIWVKSNVFENMKYSLQNCTKIEKMWKKLCIFQLTLNQKKRTKEFFEFCSIRKSTYFYEQTIFFKIRIFKNLIWQYCSQSTYFIKATLRTFSMHSGDIPAFRAFERFLMDFR